MIEITDEIIYCKKKRKDRCVLRKRRKRFLVLLIIAIIITSFVIYSNTAVFGLISEVCESEVYAYSVTAINKAASISLQKETAYSDLVKVEKNGSGDIVLMSANAVKVNDIARSVAIGANAILSDMLKDGVSVPLLAYSGIKVLSGYGRKISYKTINISSVTCDFTGEFKSVGINQTLHSLFITVKSVIDIKFLRKSRPVECESKILVSEAILVGKVPDVYLNGGLFR